MVRDEGSGTSGDGSQKSLVQALTELSETGAFGELRTQYERFLEANRDTLDPEDHALLESRNWPEIWKRLHGEREMQILCIIC